MTSKASGDRHQKGPNRKKRDSGGTGAGAEAAEGIHSANGRSSTDKSGVDTVSNSDDAGSEPLRHRKSNPKGSYGGEGGKPRK
ncbi:MAG TPA: hypothetical protein VKZ41_07010 [Gemmatimonadales bacterium]|nr:hypothetical protein [Gemmatimonadales bacterium]